MIMKNSLKKLTLLLIFLFSQLNAQSPEELIEALYSGNSLDVALAIQAINEQRVYEALPAINELFDSQPPFLQLEFLRTLLVLEDPEVATKAGYVISIADDYENFDPPLKYNSLDAKVEATLVLLELQNYSTVDYVFERINRDRPTYDAISITALELILNNLPTYEVQARLELENILTTYPDSSSNKHEAFCILVDKYGWQLQDIIINNFENVSSLPIKIKSFEYLTRFNYSGLNSLLKERISIEEFWSFRVDIADSLLTRFGEPSDLKAVIDYQPNEPDETASSLMAYSIDNFIPPKPDTLNWLGLITKLISYTSEMYSYQWIANTQTRDYYISKLNLLKSQIESGRLKDACNTVKKYLLAQIDNDLTQNNITTEGYKFLHYYSIYIRDDFSSPFQPCQ